MNLRDLSKKLGLSQTTVSRALNGYPEVNEDTRRRVQQAAIDHNYKPNTRARRLATGQSMAIGHVIPLTTQHEMVNPIFTDFLAGAGETYSKAGYDLTLSLVPDGEEEELYREIARRGSVDGVIVHAPRVKDHRIDLLNGLGIPFVVHGRTTGAETPYSWLDVDNRRAFHTATKVLTDYRHRRIALINGLEDMDFATRRKEGYLDALKDADIAPDKSLVAHGEMTEAHGYNHATRMLKGFSPPTAFLVSSMVSAIGVRRAITDAGLSVRTDVSIAIFDDDLSYFGTSMDRPVYTAVRSSVRNAGRLAGEMLLDIIRGKSDAPRHHLLDAELVIGQSTGPAPALHSVLERG